MPSVCLGQRAEAPAAAAAVAAGTRPTPAATRRPPRPPAAEDWQAPLRHQRGQRDAVRAQAGRGRSHDVPHARRRLQVRAQVVWGMRCVLECAPAPGGACGAATAQQRIEHSLECCCRVGVAALPVVASPCLPVAFLPRREVDHVITTKELAAMCQEKGIDFASLPGEGAHPLEGGRRCPCCAALHGTCTSGGCTRASGARRSHCSLALPSLPATTASYTPLPVCFPSPPTRRGV